MSAESELRDEINALTVTVQELRDELNQLMDWLNTYDILPFTLPIKH